MANDQDEFRSLGTLSLTGRKIVGIAIPYNKTTTLGPNLCEVIRPGAVGEFLRGGPKVVAIQEHQPQYVLGSTADGTLKLIDGEDALRYEIDPPDAGYANDLLQTMAKNPNTYGASFHMRVEPGGFTFKRSAGGGYTRDISRISNMREITITAFPCYTDTTAMLRSARELEQTDPAAAAALVRYLEIRGLA